MVYQQTTVEWIFAGQLLAESRSVESGQATFMHGRVQSDVKLRNNKRVSSKGSDSSNIEIIR